VNLKSFKNAKHRLYMYMFPFKVNDTDALGGVW